MSNDTQPTATLDELPHLADRVAVLRDEVLDTAERGDRDPPGAEVFAAVRRSLGQGSLYQESLVASLEDDIARSLAWGDIPTTILADAEQVFDRLITASDRAFASADDRIAVVIVVTRIAGLVAQTLAQAAVQLASRDRGTRLREELAQRQLRDAIAQQRERIARLETELRDNEVQ